MVFGLALVLALLFGVATMALAAVPGDPFKLGQANRIDDALTTLIGSREGAMLKVDNDSTAPNARALDLRVEPGKSPMTVNSGTKVPNLNADRLDGLDSTELGTLDVTVRSTTFTIPANSANQAAAECESGEIAVGGGFQQSLGSQIEIFQDRPYNPAPVDAPPDRWLVGGFNPDPSESEYKVFAVCAKR